MCATVMGFYLTVFLLEVALVSAKYKHYTLYYIELVYLAGDAICADNSAAGTSMGRCD